MKLQFIQTNDKPFTSFQCRADFGFIYIDKYKGWYQISSQENLVHRFLAKYKTKKLALAFCERYANSIENNQRKNDASDITIVLD